MGIALVQFALLHSSGLPEDDAINTWHFDPGATPVADVASDLVAAVLALWEGVRPSTNHLTDWLAEDLSGDWQARVYDLADPGPRTPVLIDGGAFSTPLGESGTLPREVCICLSNKAAISSGDIAARFKGRQFLGPWTSTVNDTTNGRPASAVITDIVDAGADLITASASAGAPWCVFSRVDNVGREIVGGWVDNAFDTQRRRGLRPSARTTF